MIYEFYKIYNLLKIIFNYNFHEYFKFIKNNILKYKNFLNLNFTLVKINYF